MRHNITFIALAIALLFGDIVTDKIVDWQFAQAEPRQ